MYYNFFTEIFFPGDFYSIFFYIIGIMTIVESFYIIFPDGNFDIPDRTFHAVKTTWRLASSDSTTDFKELTPEFFFLPEMFLNSEGE